MDAMGDDASGRAGGADWFMRQSQHGLGVAHTEFGCAGGVEV